MQTENEIRHTSEQNVGDESRTFLYSMELPSDLMARILFFITQKRISISQYISQLFFRELIHNQSVTISVEKTGNILATMWRLTSGQLNFLQKAAAHKRVSVRDFVLGVLETDLTEHTITGVLPAEPLSHSDIIAKGPNLSFKLKNGFYTCTMYIGNVDKANIQMAARKESMTFQRYAVENIFRRIMRRPPIKRIERQQTNHYRSVITFRLSEWHNAEIKKAAVLEGLSVTDYVLGAVFGDYPLSPVLSGTKDKNESRIISAAAEGATGAESRHLSGDRIKTPSKTPVQKNRLSDPDAQQLRAFIDSECDEPVFTWNAPIGSENNTLIQKVLLKTGKTFQELVLERVYRRLTGKPPVRLIDPVKRDVSEFCLNLPCSLTRRQMFRINKAALKAGTSVQEYILEALYGIYSPEQKVCGKTSRNSFPIQIKTTEKERIQRAANLAGKTFDEYILHSVKRRLEDLPPVKTIPCSMFQDSMTEIRIPRKIIESRKVRAAARAEKQSLEDYIRFAIFGTYRSGRPPLSFQDWKLFHWSGKITAKSRPSADKTESAGSSDNGSDIRKPAKKTREKEEIGNWRDYAHTNYESVYRHIIHSDPSLEPFIDKLRQIPPPQYGEYFEILRKLKTGDKSAQKRLTEMYIRTAVRIGYLIAKQYDLELSDSINEACIGLLSAIERVDPDSDRRILSYISWRAKNKVVRSFAIRGSSFTLPVYMSDYIFSAYPLLKEKGCLDCKNILYCAAVRRLLSDVTGSYEYQTEYLIRTLASAESMESICRDKKETETVTDDEENPDIGEDDGFEFPSSEIGPEQNLTTLECRQLIRNAIESLSYRERQMLCLRFGIADGYPYTLEETAHIFRVTRERIRQIVEKAIKKLRYQIQINCFDEEDFLSE